MRSFKHGENDILLVGSEIPLGQMIEGIEGICYSLQQSIALCNDLYSVGFVRG